MRFLITAGPTREPIDAVRFISNRSSGRMGIALAQAAADAGHAVTLLLGPPEVAPEVPGNPPAGAGGLSEAGGLSGLSIVRFETTAELQALLAEHFPKCEVLIMAAAVADYRPVERIAGKLERGGHADDVLTLSLEPTPDVVAGLAQHKRADQRIVAFALEEAAKLEARAAAKLERKGVDAIVANPLETMGSETISPLWLTPGARSEPRRVAAPGGMSKTDFARWLIEMSCKLKVEG